MDRGEMVRFVLYIATRVYDGPGDEKVPRQAGVPASANKDKDRRSRRPKNLKKA